MPAPRRPEHLRTQICNDLRGRLQRAEIGVDERLVDTEIAAQLGVSRMPAREALLQLVNEGYLVSTTRGFMQPELTPTEIADIFEVRQLLEPRAAAQAARDLTPQAAERLGAILDDARKAAATNDIEGLTLANILFRQTWLEQIGNLRLAETIARFSGHVDTVRFKTLGRPGTAAVVVRGLERLHRAFITHDAVTAQDLMSDFLREARESFFAALEVSVSELAVKRARSRRR